MSESESFPSDHRLDQPLQFKSGQQMKNRFMLAPLTNSQSHADGRLSDEEFHWLTMRAKGQFGLTMTCAAHVQAVGQGFPGQLGIFGDEHLDGHTRLAKAIKDEGSIAVVQLHHAGMRSPKELIGQSPVCPSDDAETALGRCLWPKSINCAMILSPGRCALSRRGTTAWKSTGLTVTSFVNF